MIRLLQFLTAGPAAALRPRMACELQPEGVLAARLEASGQAPVAAFAPLPAGSVAGGPKTPNLIDRAAVVAALRKALDEVASRDRQTTLVIPDAAVRVLLLDFDTLPSKAADVLPVIRFRLRKLVPFDVDDAAVSYQIVEQRADVVRATVAVIPREVLDEYESAVREAGYEPGVVLPSSLAAVAALRGHDPALVVHRNGNTLTTAIARQNDLLLHRTVELPPNPVEEIQRTVSVAVAYFEDTLAGRPESLFYSGPGGAAEFAGSLAEEGLRVRDLVASPATGNATAIPRGSMAAVAGALES